MESRRKKIRRYSIWGGVAVLAVAVTILVFRPKKIAVETARLVRGRFEETIRADGRFQGRTRTTVLATAGGTLGATTLRAGDEIKKGQAIATLSWDRDDVVRAPLAGVVSKVYREGGGPVTRGEPVIDIVDSSDLEVVLELLTADAVRVKPGFETRISGWGGPEIKASVFSVSRAGFVKQSSLGVEEERTEVRARLQSPPKDAFGRIGDRFHLEATLILSVSENVLTVPLGAVFRDKEGWAVFAIQNGRAEFKRITLGAQNETSAVVTAGLVEGDEVILYPGDRLKPDDPVQPRGGGF